MPKAPNDALRRCAGALDHALELRDAQIAAMRKAGFSLREIARAAQLTPQGVKHVLSRNPRAADGADPARQLERWSAKAHRLTLERAQLLFALSDDFSERQLAELSG